MRFYFFLHSEAHFDVSLYCTGTWIGIMGLVEAETPLVLKASAAVFDALVDLRLQATVTLKMFEMQHVTVSLSKNNIGMETHTHNVRDLLLLQYILYICLKKRWMASKFGRVKTPRTSLAVRQKIDGLINNEFFDENFRSLYVYVRNASAPLF